MSHEEFLDRLAADKVGHVVRRASLRDYSHWKVGGIADLLVEPDDVAQIQRVLRLTFEAQVPLVLIGDGCNLLFGDEGVRGVVMKVGRRLSRVQIEGRRVRAEAGAWIPGLARQVARAGLSGIEHTIGIPSTLGGLIAMNGGSLRRGIGEVIETVRVITREGVLREVPHAECGFARRRSVFQGSGEVIVAGQMMLEPGDWPRMRSEMLEIMRSRRKKYPLKMPNCGSTFVSGGEMYDRFGPPGAVIEAAGLKGRRIGDAQISPLHANVLVNCGQARAADLLELIRLVRHTVHARTDVWMECEVRFVAPDGRVFPAHEAL